MRHYENAAFSFALDYPVDCSFEVSMLDKPTPPADVDLSRPTNDGLGDIYVGMGPNVLSSPGHPYSVLIQMTFLVPDHLQKLMAQPRASFAQLVQELYQQASTKDSTINPIQKVSIGNAEAYSWGSTDKGQEFPSTIFVRTPKWLCLVNVTRYSGDWKQYEPTVGAVLSSFSVNGVPKTSATTVVSTTTTTQLSSSTLLPVDIGTNYGFIDAAGQMVIPAKYQRASDFSGGLALVWTNKLYGYINADGKMVIPPKFERAFDFSEGLAGIEAGDHYGFINKSGNVVIKATYDNAESFCGGLALVKVGQLYGFIHTDGSYAITPKYADAFAGFCDAVSLFLPTGSRVAASLAPVKDGTAWGYVDKKGNMAIPAQYRQAGPFSEGLASVQVASGEWGVIDEKGRMVIAPQAGERGDFSEGLARVNPGGVMRGGHWGFMNTSGDIVIKPQFTFAYPFTEGLAPVCLGNKWGFIDKSGEMVISAVFDQARNFDGGFAWVRVGNQQGYVDRSGRLIMPVNGFQD